MELVYLWVEKYKNIEKQGFNFSPKYRCEYNPDTLKLKIEDNPNYVKDLFPENINITAIVGKNGSGKSSVLELIKLIDENSLSYVKEYISNVIVVFELKGKILYESTLKNIKTDINKIGEDKKYKIYYYFSDKSSYGVKIPNIFNLGEKKYIILEEKIIIEKIIKLKFDKNFNLSSFMYIPTRLFAYHKNRINELFKKILIVNTITHKEKAKEVLKTVSDIYYRFLIILYVENHFIKRKLNLFNNLEGYHIDNFSDEEIECLKNIKCLEKSLKNELISNRNDFEKFFIREQNVIIDKVNEKEKEIYSRYYEYYDNFDLIDNKNRKYNDLSYGEKILFGQLLLLYSILKEKSEDNIIFIFDEPSLSFHPYWQMYYIKELYNLLNKFSSYIHLIITTHSPFIISDLPKENIIFLDKDENGKCKVVDGLNEKKETFGANIHTLLSDSFFMEDGLIGKFAESKINEVIKYLNNENSEIKNDDEAQGIINIIGEPILKKELQRRLDSKKLDEIQRIEEEIELLKQRLEILRKNS